MSELQQVLLDSEHGVSLNEVSEINTVYGPDGSFQKVVLGLKTGGSVEGFGESEAAAGLDALRQVAALNPPEGDKAALEE